MDALRTSFADLPWADLSALLQQYPGDPMMQSILAPLEQRAYALELSQVDPFQAASMLGLLAATPDAMGMAQRNAYKEATGASIDASETPETRGPAGYQGVGVGPKGPGASKAAFIAEQLRRGKDPATAQRMADQIYGIGK